MFGPGLSFISRGAALGTTLATAAFLRAAAEAGFLAGDFLAAMFGSLRGSCGWLDTRFIGVFEPRRTPLRGGARVDRARLLGLIEN